MIYRIDYIVICRRSITRKYFLNHIDCIGRTICAVTAIAECTNYNINAISSFPPLSLLCRAISFNYDNEFRCRSSENDDGLCAHCNDFLFDGEHMKPRCKRAQVDAFYREFYL